MVQYSPSPVNVNFQAKKCTDKWRNNLLNPTKLELIWNALGYATFERVQVKSINHLPWSRESFDLKKNVSPHTPHFPNTFSLGTGSRRTLRGSSSSMVTSSFSSSEPEAFSKGFSIVFNFFSGTASASALSTHFLSKN